MYSKDWNPPNRFDPVVVTWDEGPPTARLHVVEDDTRGILSHNDSPDLGFSWSVNPYRGCTHACAYCYARAFHEFLGLGAGSDFERRITVKTRAAALLEAAFLRPSWRGELVAFSGVTDCYQPLERRYRLTRACLEVAARFRNPVSIVTRSPLITRDLDVLVELAAVGAVAVSVSIPVVEREVVRAIEPGAPRVASRLQAVAALAEAGIPVGVSLAPIIPGLSDHTLPLALRRAREAGARFAWSGLLRLSGSVAEVFEVRLREALPYRADSVLRKLRQARGGRLGAGFATGRSGSHADPAWQSTRALFELWHRRLGFEESWRPPEPSPFRRVTRGPQLSLFGDG